MDLDKIYASFRMSVLNQFNISLRPQDEQYDALPTSSGVLPANSIHVLFVHSTFQQVPMELK